MFGFLVFYEKNKKNKVFWSMSGNVWFLVFLRKTKKKWSMSGNVWFLVFLRKTKKNGPCLEMFGFFWFFLEKKTKFCGPCLEMFGFWRFLEKPKKWPMSGNVWFFGFS